MTRNQWRLYKRIIFPLPLAILIGYFLFADTEKFPYLFYAGWLIQISLLWRCILPQQPAPIIHPIRLCLLLALAQIVIWILQLSFVICLLQLIPINSQFDPLRDISSLLQCSWQLQPWAWIALALVLYRLVISEKNQRPHAAQWVSLLPQKFDRAILRFTVDYYQGVAVKFFYAMVATAMVMLLGTVMTKLLAINLVKGLYFPTVIVLLIILSLFNSNWMNQKMGSLGQRNIRFGWVLLGWILAMSLIWVACSLMYTLAYRWVPAHLLPTWQVIHSEWRPWSLSLPLFFFAWILSSAFAPIAFFKPWTDKMSVRQIVLALALLPAAFMAGVWYLRNLWLSWLVQHSAIFSVIGGILLLLIAIYWFFCTDRAISFHAYLPLTQQKSRWKYSYVLQMLLNAVIVILGVYLLDGVAYLPIIGVLSALPVWVVAFFFVVVSRRA